MWNPNKEMILLTMINYGNEKWWLWWSTEFLKSTRIYEIKQNRSENGKNSKNKTKDDNNYENVWVFCTRMCLWNLIYVISIPFSNVFFSIWPSTSVQNKEITAKRRNMVKVNIFSFFTMGSYQKCHRPATHLINIYHFIFIFSKICIWANDLRMALENFPSHNMPDPIRTYI